MTTIKCILILLLVLCSYVLSAKKNAADSTLNFTPSTKTFNYKSLIIPTALIGYGALALSHKEVKDIDLHIRREMRKHIKEKILIDDFLQYTPALAVYGLNATGVHGKHNLLDRSIILGTSYLLMGATVNGLKYTTRIQRPDGSTRNSFPSGHTATAFVGAEFLYQEYKEKALWIGISGYLAVAFTGYLRMHNDRHWFSDVVTGAGIGILSTKAAYWIYPYIKEKLFPNVYKENTSLMPFYNGKQYGLSLSMTF